MNNAANRFDRRIYAAIPNIQPCKFVFRCKREFGIDTNACDTQKGRQCAHFLLFENEKIVLKTQKEQN